MRSYNPSKVYINHNVRLVNTKHYTVDRFDNVTINVKDAEEALSQYKVEHNVYCIHSCCRIHRKKNRD